jgi:predicted alpha/beta superfamily hydrolase
LRVLPKSPSGRQYQLHVGLPASYGTDKTRRYPVVYVTDAYWDFQKLTAVEGVLVYDKLAPEFIVVGIGYPGENLDYGKMRNWELAPATFPGMTPEDSGHSAEFLKSIKEEIIPFVEKEYRADPSFRVMSGSSMGGLFTLFAMFTEPDLFQGYVAASPAAIACNDWIFGYEEAFAKSGKAINARCFASGGGNELPLFLNGIIRINQKIASRHYKGLSYQFRYIEDERHTTMQLDSYVRGLIFVFAPLAPDSGPAGSM